MQFSTGAQYVATAYMENSSQEIDVYKIKFHLPNPTSLHQQIKIRL